MHLPRWGILLIDLGIVVFSIALAHVLRFNFELESIDYHHVAIGGWILLGLRLLAILLFKTYTGIIFHTGLEDAKRITYALFSVTLLIGLLVNPLSAWLTEHYILPYSILIIEFVVSIFLMISYRAIIKVLYLRLTNFSKEKKSVIIYGAGMGGVNVKNVLDRDTKANYSVTAFVDDDENLSKKRLLGIEIFPGKKLERLLRSSQPDIIIFSTLSIQARRRQEIAELAVKYGVKILNVPPMDKWINGELSVGQIRELRIEDLLERNPIQLDFENIEKQLKGKVILVTGAAGSIGSEIARQAIRFKPGKLILLDQAETPLHNLDLEMAGRLDIPDYEVVVGDVRNRERMSNVFQTFRPDYVYHAAAYKHVPLMEDNPSEALLTNIQGTRIVADLAVEYKAGKFVLVSTDKAVNPTSIMGASKRIAEIYVQSLDRMLGQNGSSTRFVTTRFGNVLGSNGSVIPLFKAQIQAGGPVTVTHPEMTRYFMTIPEACQLVMEAGAMGNGGEIYVFDMGSSIRIYDLARRMIRLSGLEPERDIDIVFTGLRPGEKLFEELLNKAETTMPTHNRKILIAKVREYPFSEIEKKVDELIHLFGTQDNERIVRCLKSLVPEYKSNNSVFEKLDEP